MSDTEIGIPSPKEVERLFTRADGRFLFARWGRPIVPVVFGVKDETVPVLKGAIEAVVALAGHSIAETDPELGANLMIFFLEDWGELPEVPNLGRLIPDLDPLVTRLRAAGARQYRSFRFDDAGAIMAAFTFVRIDREMMQLPAGTIALDQAVQTILSWSDTAFGERSPLAQAEGGGPALVKPGVAEVIRAGYDPVLPAHSADPALALRLAARMGSAR